MKHIPFTMSERVRLNVGGVHFETTKETLMKAPYFEALLSRWHQDQQEIYIDRSGVGFEHVLNLLRDSSYDFPRQYKNELDYYCIDYEFPPDETNVLKKKVIAILKYLEVLNETQDFDLDVPNSYCMYCDAEGRACLKHANYNCFACSNHTNNLCNCDGCIDHCICPDSIVHQ